MKTKLTTKDLITAGAFGAIYLVLLTVLSSVLTIVPILFLATPLIAGIILGTVYMLYATKVPRTGAILVLAIAFDQFQRTQKVKVKAAKAA